MMLVVGYGVLDPHQDHLLRWGGIVSLKSFHLPLVSYLSDTSGLIVSSLEFESEFDIIVTLLLVNGLRLVNKTDYNSNTPYLNRS